MIDEETGKKAAEKLNKVQNKLCQTAQKLNRIQPNAFHSGISQLFYAITNMLQKKRRKIMKWKFLFHFFSLWFSFSLNLLHCVHQSRANKSFLIEIFGNRIYWCVNFSPFIFFFLLGWTCTVINFQRGYAFLICFLQHLIFSSKAFVFQLLSHPL